MERFSKLSDRDLDDLLAGKTPSGDPALEDVAAFLRDVRVNVTEDPGDETATRHLAAIVGAAQQVAEGKAAAREGSDTARLRGRSPFWIFRRNRVEPHPLSSTRVKLVTAMSFLLLLGAFCGVAAAGGLPGPVQGKVADFAGNLGVSLPSDDEGNADQPDVGNADQPNAGNADQPDAGNADQPNQGQSNQADQGNKDEPDQGNADQPDAGNADQPNQGQSDQADQGEKDEPDQGNKNEPDQGNADQPNRGQGDQADQGNSDQPNQGNQ